MGPVIASGNASGNGREILNSLSPAIFYFYRAGEFGLQYG